MFLLACLGPGPVRLIVTSTSVAVSRRAGILTGPGVAGATLTWATVTMLGPGALLSQLAWLTAAIKLAGAVYVVMLPSRAPSWAYVAAVGLLAAFSAVRHRGLALVFPTAAVQVGYRRTKSRIDTAIGAILIVLGVASPSPGRNRSTYGSVRSRADPKLFTIRPGASRGPTVQT